jgi:hypothetical protein
MGMRRPWVSLAVSILVLLASGCFSGPKTASVPVLIGKPVGAADRALAHAGLQARIVLRSSAVQPGVVVAASPGPGAAVASGATVILFVSKRSSARRTAAGPSLACRGIVGTGAAASVADVVVMLRIVGGREPGRDHPVPGTVVATDPSGRRCAQPSQTGLVYMTLVPNTYTFTGHSPSFGRNTHLCRATRTVAVTERPVVPSRPAPVADVICSAR